MFRFTPRQAVMLTFIAFGAMVGAQIGSLPVLRHAAGIDSFTFGVLTGLSTGAGILAMTLSGWLNRHFDHRSVILFMLPVIFVMLVASLLSSGVFVFGLTFIMFSFCMGTLDIFMNAEATTVEKELDKPIFASFHAAVLFVIGLFGLIAGYVAFTYGTIWSACLALPVLILALLSVNQAIPHRIEVHETASGKQVLPYRMLVLIGIIIGLDVAAELTCIQWAGQMLSEMRPDLAQYSGLGMAFYGLCNGSVRLFGDKLRARFDDMHLVMASFCIGILGFATLAFDPPFAIAIFAFAVAGCGLGLIFPCLFSVAANLAPGAPAAALSLASTVSGPPRILLPMLMGVLAQNYGLSAIYVAAGISCTVALAVTIWTRIELGSYRAKPAT